ncbi:unnamed protein product [Ambrosiozyma monospora]|uniref:Unnamed protein product n=1 Tax=Ambrosiozyma monospora TaxID=43982 RepID=A0ACB5U5A6_AMBMO|nr:unnamed protein product [Ambrosiozyma monospora]
MQQQRQVPLKTSMLPPLPTTTDPYSFTFPPPHMNKPQLASQYSSPIYTPQPQMQPFYQMPGMPTTLTGAPSTTKSPSARSTQGATPMKKRRKAAQIDPKTAVQYPCETCGKVFYKAYNLKSHMKTHSNEKPFACKYCQKAFARSHDRRRHERLHEDEKKFKCSGLLSDGVTRWGCGKRFARADALGRHFKTETGFLCIASLVNDLKEKAKMGIDVIGNGMMPGAYGVPGAIGVNGGYMNQQGQFVGADASAQFAGYNGLLPPIQTHAMQQQQQQQQQGQQQGQGQQPYRVQNETERIIEGLAMEAAREALIENRKF